MKPCYAAALALVGWYLMMPPVKDVMTLSKMGNYFPKLTIDIHTPISGWEYYGAYDTANDCEDDRARLVERADKLKEVRGKRFFAERDLYAQCIETDDLRLKETH